MYNRKNLSHGQLLQNTVHVWNPISEILTFNSSLIRTKGFGTINNIFRNLNKEFGFQNHSDQMCVCKLNSFETRQFWSIWNSGSTSLSRMHASWPTSIPTCRFPECHYPDGFPLSKGVSRGPDWGDLVKMIAESIK